MSEQLKLVKTKKLVEENLLRILTYLYELPRSTERPDAPEAKP